MNPRLPVFVPLKGGRFRFAPCTLLINGSSDMLCIDLSIYHGVSGCSGDEAQLYWAKRKLHRFTLNCFNLTSTQHETHENNRIGCYGYALHVFACFGMEWSSFAEIVAITFFGKFWNKDDLWVAVPRQRLATAYTQIFVARIDYSSNGFDQ